MSQLLYHGDYIIVQGSLSEKGCEAYNTGQAYIYLSIILQNNGKQRIIHESLELEKQGTEWELKNWDSWYTLVNILSSLQYSLSEDPIPSHGISYTNHIIKDWIQRLKRMDWGEIESNTSSIKFAGGLTSL